MTNIKIENSRNEAKVFKALGHPIRLWIVKELAKKEHCVYEFVAPSGVSFATISQHLAVLKHAGIIADKKRGKLVFYRLIRPCVMTFLSCMES